MAHARGQRRQTFWEASSTAPQTSGLQLTVTGKVLLSVIAHSGGGVLTLVRTRGTGFFGYDPAAADNDVFAAVGLIKASADAATAGAASLPGPISDADNDGWIYHRYFGARSLTGSADEAQGMLTDRFEVDSKVMRKMDGASEVLVWVAEVQTIDGGNLSVQTSHRMLWKTV